MTKDDLAAAQARIGCTGAQLAKWLGVKPLTVTRWRTGKVAVPVASSIAIEAIAEGWRPALDLIEKEQAHG